MYQQSHQNIFLNHSRLQIASFQHLICRVVMRDQDAHRVGQIHAVTKRLLPDYESSVREADDFDEPPGSRTSRREGTELSMTERTGRRLQLIQGSLLEFVCILLWVSKKLKSFQAPSSLPSTIDKVIVICYLRDSSLLPKGQRSPASAASSVLHAPRSL